MFFFQKKRKFFFVLYTLTELSQNWKLEKSQGILRHLLES